MKGELEAMEIVGSVIFKDKTLPIYSSLDVPLFRASDVAKLIEYSDGNVWKMLEMCEADEKLTLPMVAHGQRRAVSFITETGLYNILAQSRKPIARAWRRVVHEELIALRKSRGKNVAEQFQDWDDAAESIYFDEETGMMMQSVTVAGGDVDQVPYRP